MPRADTRLWRALALLLLPTAILTACASPHTRVEQGLVEAGIAKTRATCMADILVDRLSIGQLRRLGELSDLKDEAGKDRSIGYFLENSKALRDPEILAAVAQAITGCPSGRQKQGKIG